MHSRQALSILCRAVGYALLLSPDLALSQTTEAQRAATRTNLMVFHKPDGTAAPVRSEVDWLKRREEILRAAQQIMGPLPGPEKQCPLDPRVDSETDCGSYVRRAFTYASEPDSRVPAFLLVPKAALSGKKKFPAILALHPTDMEYGYLVVVEPLRASYRAYAADLAAHGFVVLAPAYPLMAAYQPDLKALGYKSGTMKAIWDNLRGLDYLQSLPFVDSKRLGAIGHSLGGHNAIYSAVFDQRIKAVVSSCGFDSFLAYKDGDIRGWTSERYMPALLEYREHLRDIPFDFFELVGAVAPRPLFINAPLHDSNFKSQSVDEIVTAAIPIYSLYHARDNLRVVHPDCGHDFPPDIREAAYKFLDQRLK
ncbi:MAG TPA: prolyl oligopeptidase family serine peptidase [Candidatus Dormibacteraeota bacterium]|nr:prolyl oligopeptidase family serine peptidase [Candidatus Dormibacteraeota bacterium]